MARTPMTPERRRRLRRGATWSVALVLALSVLLPTAAFLLTPDGIAHAQEAEPVLQEPPVDERVATPPAWTDTNPRSQTWRQARTGEPGYVAASGPYTTNTLINNSGENWRQIRNGPIHNLGGLLIILAALGVATFHMFKGRTPIEGGRAGYTVPRWSAFERGLHWFTAITFIALAITGLSMLFGRTVLIPLFGHTANAAWANVAMNIHNYVGPAFSVGVVLMILAWAKDNIFNRTDIAWFKAGGGIVGNEHPSAGKLNGGEKVWFWLGVFVLGLAVVITGFILDFPQFGQSRSTMGTAHIIHAAAALIWIGFAFGHIYIGTAGTEGALEGMTTGRVDVNWARQHHDLWYDELQEQGVRPEPADPGSPPPRPATPQRSH